MKFFKRDRNTLKKTPGFVERSEDKSDLFLEFMYGKDHVRKLKKHGTFKQYG